MRIVQVISQTPCKQPSKRCAWCCYHGGHATMLSRQMNICVRGTSASILALTCVSHHRVSLRQSVSHAPQPISTGLKQPISAQFTFEPFAAQFGSKPFGDSRLVLNASGNQSSSSHTLGHSSSRNFCAYALNRRLRFTCGRKRKGLIASVE